MTFTYRKLLGVAGFSLALSLLAALLNSGWLYDPPGWVDQQGYLGGALYFPSQSRALPFEPTGSLLPVLVPFAAAIRIFGADAGNLIRDIAFASGTAFLVGWHVARATRMAIGLVVIAVAFCSQYFLSAAGSSYTDSSVLLFFAAALYITFECARSEGKRRYLLAGTVGIAYAAMAFSAVLASTYIVVIVAYFAACTLLERAAIDRRGLALLALGLIGGLALGTGLLQLIYTASNLDGFFFRTNIEKLFDLTVGGAYRAPPLSQWLPTASWLIAPAGISVAALALLARAGRKADGLRGNSGALTLLVIGPVTLAVLIMVSVIADQWALQFLYFNQTLCAYLLSLGGVVAIAFSHRSDQNLRYWIAASVGTMVAALVIGRGADVGFATIQGLFAEAIFPVAALLLMGMLAALLAGALLGGVWKSALLPATLVVVLAVVVFQRSPVTPCQFCNAATANRSFDNLIGLSAQLDDVDPGRKAKLWYSEGGTFGALFRDVNATNYFNSKYRRISKSLPSFSNAGQPIGSGGRPPRAGDLVIAMGGEPGVPALARRTLRSRGFDVTTLRIWQRNIPPDGLAYFGAFELGR